MMKYIKATLKSRVTGWILFSLFVNLYPIIHLVNYLTQGCLYFLRSKACGGEAVVWLGIIFLIFDGFLLFIAARVVYFQIKKSNSAVSNKKNEAA